MKLTPIKLMDGKLLYQLSTGPKFFTSRSFGYHQLLTTPSLTEEEILAITTVPPLPDGIFELYKNDTQLFVSRLKDVTYRYFYVENTELIPTNSFIINNLTFVGVFASILEIKLAYPEYFI